ncbi:oligosaccharide flippase family protein [Patescibacteria group bacterium]|nr:oligosaccharide flippase family protein [Patescibacteria group bacterium]
MIASLFDLLKKPISKNILINTIGNYLNIFFTAFFAFLLVRIMSPSDYGVLSVLLGVSYVLANILDFGTSASIYSYLPPMIEKRHKNIYVFLKTILTFQTIFSAVVITLLLLFFPYLDKVFFKTGAPWWELYLTTFSVLFFIWQNYAINALNAAKKFFQANLYLNLSNFIKTLFIIILIFFKAINIATIIFTFGIFGPVIFFVLLFFEKKNIVSKIIKADIKKEEFRFGYTITFFIGSQFFNLAQRMDLFLLSFFLSKSPEVGYYGLAQKIILTVMASISSVTQVLSPNFSRITTKKDVFKELKHGLTFLLIPALLFIVLFLTPNWVFSVFFTNKFLQTAVISKALSLPYILYVFLNLPLLFLLYTIKKPLIILSWNLVYFLIVVLGCYYTIPHFGVFGPPYVIAVGFFVALIIAIFFSIKEYNKLP